MWPRKDFACNVVDDEVGDLSLPSSCRNPLLPSLAYVIKLKHYHQYSCKQYGCRAAGEFGGVLCWGRHYSRVTRKGSIYGKYTVSVQNVSVYNV